MRTRAFVLTGKGGKEPHWGAVIVREDGTGEGFGWWEARVDPNPDEQQSGWAKAVFEDPWGNLGIGMLEDRKIEAYDEPDLGELQKIRNYQYR